MVSADELRRISGHLVRYQETDGNWEWSIAPAQNRPPPYFDGDDVVTVMAAAMLQPDASDSRQKADAWLAKWVADKKLARSDQGLGGMTFTYRAHPADEAIETYLGPLVATPERKALLPTLSR